MASLRIVSGGIGKPMLLLLLSPLLFLLGLTLLPLLAVVLVRYEWKLRRLRRLLAGQTILVWSSRHDWHNFIVNNVLPVLPRNVRPFRRRSRVRTPKPEQGLRDLLGAYQRARPYLARIGRSEVSIQPLNYALLPYKGHAGRTMEVQAVVAKIVRHAGSGS